MPESPSAPVRLADLWRANALIIGLVLLSLILGSLPVVRYLLLPFEFFTTFIHEGSHAIAGLLMGESIGRIVLNPDTSGYTTTTVSGGVWARGFVASAGYTGAALFGGILIVLSAYKNMARFLLMALGVLFVVVVVFYVRDVFTLVVCFGFGAVLLGLGVKAGPGSAFYAVNFLAVQCALNSIHDVIVLIRLSLGAPRSTYSLGHSDADTVASLFFLPAIFWSVLWVVFSGLILYFAFRKSARMRMRRAE